MLLRRRYELIDAADLDNSRSTGFTRNKRFWFQRNAIESARGWQMVMGRHGCDYSILDVTDQDAVVLVWSGRRWQDRRNAQIAEAQKSPGP